VIGDLVKELDVKELKITPRVVIPAVDLRMLENRQRRSEWNRGNSGKGKLMVKLWA